MARLGIVTLCLQETRVHPDSWDAVRRAFGHQGYVVHFGEALPGPSAVGGLLVATRLPACPFPLPDSPLLRGRAMALRVAPPLKVGPLFWLTFTASWTPTTLVTLRRYSWMPSAPVVTLGFWLGITTGSRSSGPTLQPLPQGSPVPGMSSFFHSRTVARAATLRGTTRVVPSTLC